MTGLRGEAAIIGIAELPAQRRPTGPPLFTLDQYALLAKLAVEDAGVDPALVNGLLTHGVAESAMFAPATLWTTGIPAAWRIEALSAAVVVLPLVAETSTLPSASVPARRPIAPGSMRSSSLPGRLVPP